MAECHHLHLTDLHDLDSTTPHLDLMVLLLFTGLQYQPMDIQACLYLDQLEGNLGLGLPMDMHSTPDQAFPTSLILEVHHHRTSVPLCLLSLDLCFRHMVSGDQLDHVHRSLLTCAYQGHVITPSHQWTCPQVSHPSLVKLMVRPHPMLFITQQDLMVALGRTCM